MTKIAIQIDPEIQGGALVFVGTRVPVKTLFDYLEAGDSLATFCEDFPSVPQKLCVAALVAPHDRLLGCMGSIWLPLRLKFRPVPDVTTREWAPDEKGFSTNCVAIFRIDRIRQTN